MFVQSSASLASSSATRSSTVAIWLSSRSSSDGARAPFARVRFGFAGGGFHGWHRCRGLAFVSLADEVGPAPVVGAQALVLDRDEPVGNSVQHGPVVRDEQQRAGERLQRRLQRLAALQVEVVRRLVEDEQIRARGDKQREREPSPLAAGEDGDVALVHLPAGEEKPAEQMLCLGSPETRRSLRALQHGAGGRQLLLVLGEVGGDDAVADSDATVVELAPVQQRLEEGRLARAVRPYEPECSPRSSASSARSSSGLSPAEARSPRPPARHGPSAAAQELEAERAPALGRDWYSPAARERSCSSRPICVSLAWACFALFFLCGSARRTAGAARCRRRRGRPSSPPQRLGQPLADAIVPGPSKNCGRLPRARALPS